MLRLAGAGELTQLLRAISEDTSATARVRERDRRLIDDPASARWMSVTSSSGDRDLFQLAPSRFVPR